MDSRHLFLVDKKGCLRFDDINYRDGVGFENKIAALLAEQ